ncbi:aminodeoxychorismate lyase [Sporosarcina luteola]|uniref:aminodeoxychorismate lyase n=1 Tax=Sporosarcina luteola TaxID=582850 RepID=UPI0020414C42|nr:aminodeoxychorismate lyase [Sporosarcina luteola]MCM3712195.1 aminodeoxychorismate lyase [Sporosarcina luteola]
MLCWMNGEFEQAEQLQISPFDHGFLYGAGFFETFRTYEGHVFLFKEHMERLRAALREYRIAMPYSDEEILEAIRGLHVRSGERDGYFRLNVSAGVHDIGLAPSEYKSPNVILFRKDLAVVPRGTEKKAVWLETERNLPESRIRHKSHNFLNNVRGRLELPSLKELEGIFLTAYGHVAEGVTSNVFWVKDGALYTPSTETGILPGLTRGFLLKLGEEAGMDIHIGLFAKSEVEQADEVFVSNSIQELVPLSTVGERSMPGATGAYYQKLHRLYVWAIDRMKEG